MNHRCCICVNKILASSAVVIMRVTFRQCETYMSSHMNCSRVACQNLPRSWTSSSYVDLKFIAPHHTPVLTGCSPATSKLQVLQPAQQPSQRMQARRHAADTASNTPLPAARSSSPPLTSRHAEDISQNSKQKIRNKI